MNEFKSKINQFQVIQIMLIFGRKQGSFNKTWVDFMDDYQKTKKYYSSEGQKNAGSEALYIAS